MEVGGRGRCVGDGRECNRLLHIKLKAQYINILTATREVIFEISS